MGRFFEEERCPECDGSGADWKNMYRPRPDIDRKIPSPCEECGGRGRRQPPLIKHSNDEKGPCIIFIPRKLIYSVRRN
jgi:DnaJ-class molecular chaperone